MDLEIEKEIDLIAALLSFGHGHGVDLFAMLSVYELEDGRFSVTRLIEETNVHLEKIFDTATDAARCFVAIRHEMKLGYNYERPLSARRGQA